MAARAAPAPPRQLAPLGHPLLAPPPPLAHPLAPPPAARRLALQAAPRLAPVRPHLAPPQVSGSAAAAARPASMPLACTGS